MKMFRAAALASAACFVLTICVLAQNAEFTEVLKKNRGAISVQDGKLAGPSAEVLRMALAEAQFVALGEDHGIRQIPEFAAALCAELAPHGFHHMGLEIGMYVAPELEKWREAPTERSNSRSSRRNTRKRLRSTTGRKSSRCCKS